MRLGAIHSTKVTKKMDSANPIFPIMCCLVLHCA